MVFDTDRNCVPYRDAETRGCRSEVMQVLSDEPGIRSVRMGICVSDFRQKQAGQG